MHASRTRVMLPLLPLCAVALLLSRPASASASADQESLGPAVGGAGSWPADSPAEAPTTTGVKATLEWGQEDVADGNAAPPGRQTLRPRHHPSALSPEARRGLEHEAHCGPRVPVRRGAFPWPGWKPRCRGGGGAPIAAPAVHRLQPLFDEP